MLMIDQASLSKHWRKLCGLMTRNKLGRNVGEVTEERKDRVVLLLKKSDRLMLASKTET